jgi:multicomponent Na+:H+ antiporter subunit D
MYLMPLFVVLPLGAAFFISLLGKQNKRLCDVMSSVITFCLFIFSVYALFVCGTKTPTMVYKIGGWPAPIGIPLIIDGLSVFMLVTINLISFLIGIFAINYMEKFTAKYKFYTLYLLLVGGMNGVVLSGDLFNLFVFFEIASLASYALVAYGTEAEELEAAFKYMVMGVMGSLFILFAIGFLYSYTSTLTMADMANILNVKTWNKTVIFASILLIAGFGLKSAIVPFHAWLPDAHPAAPAPISAMLSGLLIKSLGVYSLCRIFYNVIGVNPLFLNLLMLLGIVSIITAGLLALGQSDIKRLLAYSSISQIGYIVLGLGTGTALGILGALFHLFNHSIFKSLLFLNAGAIEYATGSRNLEKLGGGLRQRMPVTANTCLIASMGISGVPPFNGFFSKLIIIFACVQQGYIAYAVWAVIGAVLTISYFMKLHKGIFFGELRGEYKDIKEVPVLMQSAMLVLSFMCIVGGLLIVPKFAKYFLDPAQQVLLDNTKYGISVMEKANEK